MCGVVLCVYVCVNVYICPHFVNGILIGTIYNEFLEQKLLKLLENIDFIIR